MAYLLLVPLYYKGVLPEFDFGSDTQVRVALRAFCFGYAVIDNFATTSASTPIELLPLWGLFLLSFIFLASYFYYLSNLYEHYNGNADDGAAAPEQFWKMALDNLENNKDEGLWLRCYSEAGGVNEKARAIYLQYASKRFHNAEERATENNAKAYARSQLISGLVAMVLGGAFFGNILINKSNLMEWMKSPIEYKVKMLVAGYPTEEEAESSLTFDAKEKVSDSINGDIIKNIRYTITDDSLQLSINNETVLHLKGAWGSIRQCNTKRGVQEQYLTMVFNRPIPPSRNAVARADLPFNKRALFGDKDLCLFMTDLYAK